VSGKPQRPGDRLIQKSARGLKPLAPLERYSPAVAPGPLGALETPPPLRRRVVPKYPVLGPVPEPPERTLPTLPEEAPSGTPSAPTRLGVPVGRDPGPGPSLERTLPVVGSAFDEPEPPGTSPEAQVASAGTPICPLAGAPCIGVYCQWFDMEDICAVLAIKKDLALLRQVPSALEVLEVRLGRLGS